jgi:hypothetical protein
VSTKKAPKPPKAPKAPKPARRPLDAAAFTDFCIHVGEGKSLRSWAEQEKYAASTVVEWVLADPERQKTYREARRMQADAHVDQLIELADEIVPTDAFGKMDSAAVNDKRLRIDTRKWIAAKFHPGMYADKVDVSATIRGADQKPAQVLDKIAALFATYGLKLVPEQDDGSQQPD